jgi:hypothetical protein
MIRVRDSSGEIGRAGTVDVELLLEGRCVSSCRIIPLSLRVGSAVVRMDGIGDVKTLAEYRNRGFSRRVMEHAVRRMEAGDAALTMLYGITDFYPKFGYITVGPESRITLPPLESNLALPAGYAVRDFRSDDLEHVQHLYDTMTARYVGAAVRTTGEYPWTALREGTPADCRVVTDAADRVVAYIWRGGQLVFVRAHSRYNVEDLILAEVVATEPRAADAALTVCRRWGAEEARRGRELKRVAFFQPYQGSVAAAAMQSEGTLERGYGPDGGWMARVLDTRRLLASLQPELSLRLAAAGSRFRGTVRVVTEAGEVALSIDGEDVRVEGRDSGHEGALVCRLPQTTLARLVMGTYPPDDLLARLEEPPREQAAQLLEILFPERPAQIFLADRF